LQVIASDRGIADNPERSRLAGRTDGSVWDNIDNPKRSRPVARVVGSGWGSQHNPTWSKFVRFLPRGFHTKDTWRSSSLRGCKVVGLSFKALRAGYGW